MRFAQNLSAADGALSFEDVTLGAKFSLGGQQGARPELALIVLSTLPTGGTRVTAATMLPSAVLLAGWELGGRWSLGGSAIAGREVDDHLELAGSAVVGYTLSDRWRSYVETFTIQPVSGNGGERGESYLNGGFAHLITPMVQVDVRAGVGIGGARRATSAASGCRSDGDRLNSAAPSGYLAIMLRRVALLLFLTVAAWPDAPRNASGSPSSGASPRRAGSMSATPFPFPARMVAHAVRR